MINLVFNDNNQNHMETLKYYSKDIDKMVIVSPFLSEEIIDFIKKFYSLKRLDIYTNLDGFGAGASIVKALDKTFQYCEDKGIEFCVKYHDSLHGKAYLLYENEQEKGFLVTSANFTNNGLNHNIEFGVFLSDSSMQQHLYQKLLSMNFLILRKADIVSAVKALEAFEKKKVMYKPVIFKVGNYIKNRKYNIDIPDETIKEKIKEYKSVFSSRFQEQKYLWEAVNTFHKEWDIELLDVSNMYKRATEEADTLLYTKGFQPRRFMIQLSQKNPTFVKELMKQLFDERYPVEMRIDEFENKIASVDKKSYHEDVIAVSTYLWLMYPEKYYFYKWAVCTDVAEKMGIETISLRESRTNKMIWAFQLYDEIKEFLLNDQELQNIVHSNLTDRCYRDEECHCLTMDFCFFIHSIYAGRKDKSKVNG